MVRLSVALLVLLIVAPTASAARRCSPLGGPTVAENARVTVARIAGDEGRIVACAKRTGRRTAVDVADPEHPLARTVRVAGRFVALDSELSTDRYSGDARSGVTVWDVEIGRRRAAWSAFVLNRPERPAHTPRVGSLVLSRLGSVAFAIDDEAGGVARVHRLTLGGQDGGHRVLDRGPGVDARSVRRDGKRVLWRRDGGVRSAHLR